MIDVIIVGGGLAGLINSILLSNAGLEVMVIEKKAYPFEKVCGEYVSNEVVPFLQSINLYPDQIDVSRISRFQISSVSGTSAILPLDLGGFGISRYELDHFLYLKSKKSGAKFLLNSIVQEVSFLKDHFKVVVRDGTEFQSRLVIGSYGKRSGLDKNLKRKFFFKKSPFIGVKYHVKADFPRDLVALHNFSGGYCGIAAIEEDKVNLCYLSSRDNLKKSGSIAEMEERILCKNPHLKSFFSNCTFISEKPEVINEISFAPKSAVEQHILMCGDTAGMISPLCGNGMAMAIHSAKILSGLIAQFYKSGSFNRALLERAYVREWSSIFARRLWIGRNVQKLFGSEMSSEVLVRITKSSRKAAQWIIKQTHGEAF